jgi:hypothetical protein
VVVSGDCHAGWPGCPEEICLGRAVRGPCADAGRVQQGSLWVPAHAHGVLACERTYAEIAGSTKTVWASPRVTGADHNSQRAFLPLYDVPAMVNYYGKLRDGGWLWKLPYIYQTT